MGNSKERFVTCQNNNCNKLYLISSKDICDAEFLCNECRAKLQTSHVVQCLKCETIVELLTADSSESPIVFYLQNCANCCDDKLLDTQMKAFHFPESFV